MKILDENIHLTIRTEQCEYVNILFETLPSKSCLNLPNPRVPIIIKLIFFSFGMIKNFRSNVTKKNVGFVRNF